MTIRIPKSFPKYLEHVKQQPEPEDEVTHKTILVKKETYDRLLQMGNMTTTFNDVITDSYHKACSLSSA